MGGEASTWETGQVSRGLPEDILYGKLPAPVLSTVLTAVNAGTGQMYVTERGLPGTMGAWVVRSPYRDLHVLKVVSNHDTVAQVRESAEVAHSVDSPACRSPRYDVVQYTPGVGTWYLQEFLEGEPAPLMDIGLVREALHITDRGADRGRATAYDYAARVQGFLRGDEFGWRAAVASHSPAGQALVQRADSLLARCRGLSVGEHDAVHGDLTQRNLLVSQSRKLIGCVDWDLAGRGDRSLDIARLLYACQATDEPDNDAVNLLRTRLIERSGETGLIVFSVYWALMVADWSIRRLPGATAALIKVGDGLINAVV